MSNLHEELSAVCTVVSQTIDDGLLGSVHSDVESGVPYVFVYPRTDSEAEFTAVRDELAGFEVKGRVLEFCEGESDTETHSWVAFKATE